MQMTFNEYAHAFWRGKRVFVTGHTGFKGSWLCLWLHALGAKVTGYALEPLPGPNMYEMCGINDLMTSIINDIRDLPQVKDAVDSASPEVVIHMAAQPLVRVSYAEPVDTYSTNVMGTVNILEAVRHCKSVRSFVNVTTDKCYENKEWYWGYRETEPFGGFDPYSNSKACSELVTAAYRSSYFNASDYGRHGVGIASARAGNVIGGGDWAVDRLIPDCVRALLKKEKIIVRNPASIRPWQHVLEPLSGYLTLAQRLHEDGPAYADGWNFGPSDEDAKPVEWIVKAMCDRWGEGAEFVVDKGNHPHEANYLKLDCSKARMKLGWRPRWNLDGAINRIIEWTKAYKDGKEMKDISLRQIEEFCSEQPASH
ncbi:MAG: CDP-glucose 4,6-dehydratase [Geobacteraceae bacterium]|nr:CDP-glucose 4,6-dehydratase [Geobacteraceae bacterium]